MGRDEEWQGVTDTLEEVLPTGRSEKPCGVREVRRDRE